MINDWGFLDRSRRRPYPIEVEHEDKVVGVPEAKISSRYIDLLEVIWEDMNDGNP